MKYIKRLLLIVAAATVMVGCLDKEELGIEVGTATSPVVTTPSVGEQYILDKDSASALLATFEWEQEGYGISLPYNYELLLDVEGGDFSDPQVLATSDVNSVDITNSMMNNAALALGGSPDSEITVEMMVKSVIKGVDIDTLYSARVNIMVTPYVAEMEGFPEELYMIGDAVGGWDWAAIDLPMIPVNSHPELFWKIVYMENSGSFKFAPMKAWVNDFGVENEGDGGLGEWGVGKENITPPTEAGYYMVVVDLSSNKISIAEVEVYMIGNTVASWDTANSDAKFVADRGSDVVTITKDLVADEIRIYAWHPYFTDWWQSEFIVLDDKIEFRGTGDDQDRALSVAGSNTIELNFTTGLGSIN